MFLHAMQLLENSCAVPKSLYFFEGAAFWHSMPLLQQIVKQRQTIYTILGVLLSCTQYRCWRIPLSSSKDFFFIFERGFLHAMPLLENIAEHFQGVYAFLRVLLSYTQYRCWRKPLSSLQGAHTFLKVLLSCTQCRCWKILLSQDKSFSSWASYDPFL